MPDPSDKDISADRRRFFRQILFTAIDTAEKVGKTIAEKHLPHPPPEKIPAWNDDWYHAPREVHGPPWPPQHGPAVPLGLMRQLQEQRRQAVARGDFSYGDPHAVTVDPYESSYDPDHPDYDPRHDQDDDFHIHGAERKPDRESDHEPDGEADASSAG